MPGIDITELYRLSNEAPRPPLLPPLDDEADIFTCPICLEFKPAHIVIHSNCGRAFCAADAANLVVSGQSCPLCRGPLQKADRSRTKFELPRVLERHAIEQVRFECPSCNAKLYLDDALSHPKLCLTQNRRHVPPVHIPTSIDNIVRRNELVSNPREPNPDKTPEHNRLIIFHHNGEQVLSACYNPNWEMERVKFDLARKLWVSPSNINLFKFIHIGIDDHAIVRDVCHSRGATHLTSFNLPPNLEDLTINLNFDEEGPPPYVPRPVAPPHGGPQQPNNPNNNPEEESWE